MKISAEDIIREFNKAITNPKKYRETFIKNMDPNHRSATLLKTQQPRQPVEIDYLLFKMADEILKDIIKKKSDGNDNYSSIYKKYGKIKVPSLVLGKYNSNIKIDYIISKLLNDNYNLIFSDNYDSITTACSQKNNTINVLIIFYKNFALLENDDDDDDEDDDDDDDEKYGTNNNSNNYRQNSQNMFGNNFMPNNMMKNMQKMMEQFNVGNFFNGNMFTGQNVNVNNMQNINFNINGENRNFQQNTNDYKKKNDMSESKLFFIEETLNELKELKEKINEYREFDEDGAKRLINKIDEKIQKPNPDLKSMKECKNIKKEAQQWIEGMKMKKLEKLEKENERINNELKQANRSKKELEHNYRVLIEKRNKK